MKNRQILVSPSILSADFANLQRDVEKIEKAGADWVHVDVMDGHFVPNITIGAPVVKSLRKVTQLPLDVHLMIDNPQKYVADFAKAGADFITIHQEAPCSSVSETIDMIKSYGVKAGVSIKPNTPAEDIEYLLEKLDLILVMTVEPGFGGQSFMYECLPKIEKIRFMLEKRNLSNVFVEVDGGINANTAAEVVKAGANVLVAGSYIYNADNIQQSISSLKNI